MQSCEGPESGGEVAHLLSRAREHVEAGDLAAALDAWGSAAESGPEERGAGGLRFRRPRPAPRVRPGGAASCPGAVEPYRELAWLFHGFEQYLMSVHYLRLLAERATPTARDYYFLAVLLHDMTRREEAIMALQDALRLEQNHVKSRFLLGMNYLYK